MSNILPSSQPSVPATSISQDPPRNRSGRILRKRVKTGCLTCRRRRIKCGEQRPSCYNCIKSKRDCDYNKGPVFPVASQGYGRSFGHEAVRLSDVSTSFQQQPPAYSTYFTSSAPLLTPQTPYVPQFPQTTPIAFAPSQPNLQQHPFTFEASASYPSPAIVNTPSFPVLPQQSRSEDFFGDSTPYSSLPRQPFVTPVYERPVHHPQWHAQADAFSNASSEPLSVQTWSHEVPIETPGPYTPDPRALSDAQDAPNKRRNIGNDVYGSGFGNNGAVNLGVYPSPRPSAPSFGRPDHNTILELGAVEYEDDEYFDVLPEEEEEEEEDAFPVVSGVSSYALPSINSLPHGIPPDFPSTVGLYNESQAASPLKNQATQMIFRNFIWHTAPALSVFERPSVWTTPLAPPPGAYGAPSSCWMDALPKMALHDPGLLHAMLAQSSYEIAKAQGASTTPSGKHYAWSLRRVHRKLSSSKKRRYLTTLAATLLLGFYEILTADHVKWSMHLTGARSLITESNYKGLTNEVRRRVTVGSKLSSKKAGDAAALASFCDHDYNLIESLMGFRELDTPDSSQPYEFAHMDLSLYPIQQDLFWWYCKQDAYHSIVSGNDLLLPYHRWADCPPRSEIGDANAIYGSHDYLMLLLGRIASFAANDRPRKIKVNRMRPPPSQSGQQQPSPITPQTPSPPFYGMAPSSGQPQLPRAYGTETIKMVANDMHLNSSPGKLEAATQKAHREWNEIRAACDNFANRLGWEFRPLTSDEEPSFQTPFGDSCHFRSYEIANLWLVYYLAMLVLLRAHPSKPAAAHVSVGVSARETAWYANEIGRIAAGVTPPDIQSQAHFKFLGAYTGSVVPLFFAGVQYQAAPQRFWTVERLQDIGRTCGWTTAETCANGCETSWTRAATMGRGAPWTRINQDLSSSDQRLSLRYLLNGEEGQDDMDPLDRRLLPYQPDARLLWGYGILGTSEDLAHESIAD